MGSGKSHNGRNLAARLDMPFYDLDQIIIHRNNRSIPDIFREKGEQAFRYLEREALESTIFYDKAVIACGGGTPCFFNNMAWINQHGLSVFLNPTVPLLMNRLQKGRERRPLIAKFSDEELLHFIDQKLKERLPFYEQALLAISQSSNDDPITDWIEKELSKIADF